MNLKDHPRKMYKKANLEKPLRKRNTKGTYRELVAIFPIQNNHSKAISLQIENVEQHSQVSNRYHHSLLYSKPKEKVPKT